MTHGVHLTVTFAVAGRKLVKEEVRVQRVSMSFQRGGGARGLKLERVEPTDAPFAKALQRQRARLEACGKRADGASGRLGFDVRFEADGRVSKVVRDDARVPEAVLKCLETALRQVRGPPGDAGQAHVLFALQ